MYVATFQFGKGSKLECRVVCGNFGHERYFVNEVLVHKHWSLSPSGSREFAAHGHQVRVQLAVNLKLVEGKAFVNGVLISDDIFSELNAKLIRMRQDRPIHLRVIVWIVVSLIIFSAYKALIAVT
jgi:hypothetical protein